MRLKAADPLFDLASYGRRGPGHRDTLSPEQMAQVARTVRRAPEVIVKVSGGGTSVKAVVAHFKYLNRRQDFEIESDEGEHLHGRAGVTELVAGWDLDAAVDSSYESKPGRKPTKLVHNVVLSMPRRTDPKKLLTAARAFAREQFALKHRYAMVLHTDKDHPHVHLVVKALSEEGQRLNIRKATLRGWRREFARHLREHGIEANATERQARGVTEPRKTDGIFRAMGDKKNPRYSTHMQRRVGLVAADLLAGGLKVESAKSQLLATRKEVEQAWRTVGDILEAQGQRALAAEVRAFVRGMPRARTESEWIAEQLAGRLPGWKVGRDQQVR